MPFSTEPNHKSQKRAPLASNGFPYPVTETDKQDIPVFEGEKLISIIRKTKVILLNFSGWQVKVLGKHAKNTKYFAHEAHATCYWMLEGKRINGHI